MELVSLMKNTIKKKSWNAYSEPKFGWRARVLVILMPG
jgi:hypothetical protein